MVTTTLPLLGSHHLHLFSGREKGKKWWPAPCIVYQPSPFHIVVRKKEGEKERVRERSIETKMPLDCHHLPLFSGREKWKKWWPGPFIVYHSLHFHIVERKREGEGQRERARERERAR